MCHQKHVCRKILTLAKLQGTVEDSCNLHLNQIDKQPCQIGGHVSNSL